ncbi:MAG TPA: fdrA domain protein [Firmicutes bacterium]|nr:fdrA domain protein [Bacillota bacterium]
MLPDQLLNNIQQLFSSGPKVINLGLEEFANSVKLKEVPVVHVQWKPPAMGDESLLKLLDKLR